MVLSSFPNTPGQSEQPRLEGWGRKGGGGGEGGGRGGKDQGQPRRRLSFPFEGLAPRRARTPVALAFSEADLTTSVDICCERIHCLGNSISRNLPPAIPT